MVWKPGPHRTRARAREGTATTIRLDWTRHRLRLETHVPATRTNRFYRFFQRRPIPPKTRFGCDIVLMAGQNDKSPVSFGRRDFPRRRAREIVNSSAPNSSSKSVLVSRIPSKEARVLIDRRKKKNGFCSESRSGRNFFLKSFSAKSKAKRTKIEPKNGGKSADFRLFFV